MDRPALLRWPKDTDGVVTLPSGRQVRGRGLEHGPMTGPEPELGIYLSWRRPPLQRWNCRWVRWPDFWLPASAPDCAAALGEAWVAAVDQRVEVACAGGIGRTGTALACLAVLDGVAPGEAVAFIRERYSPRAVETPWQHRFVRRFAEL